MTKKPFVMRITAGRKFITTKIQFMRNKFWIVLDKLVKGCYNCKGV